MLEAVGHAMRKGATLSEGDAAKTNELYALNEKKLCSHFNGFTSQHQRLLRSREKKVYEVRELPQFASGLLHPVTRLCNTSMIGILYIVKIE